MKIEVVCLTDYLPKVQEETIRKQQEAESKGKPFSFGRREETKAVLHEIYKNDVLGVVQRHGEYYFVIQKGK